jgi:non-POU domain-containing octamer-binding protein
MHTPEKTELIVANPFNQLKSNLNVPQKVKSETESKMSAPSTLTAPATGANPSQVSDPSTNVGAAALNNNKINNPNVKPETAKNQQQNNNNKPNQQQNKLPQQNNQQNNKNQPQNQGHNKNKNQKFKNLNKNQQNGNKQNIDDQNVQKKHHHQQNGHFNKQYQNQQQNQNFQPQHDRKFTGRCRLFVGNLPAEITEAEFKELFVKFGEIGEVFLNPQRSFGFIKLDTRINAEHAKQELDGLMCKGRCLRVRFASHGAAIKIKHLSPYVSNEYLEQAFGQFGQVERAVVIVDDKGRPTGEGIVEFERKPSALQCISRCAENCFILTSYPRPIVVEPFEQKDEEDGLPEKSIVKNPQYYSERENSSHFAQNGSFEQEIALKWIEFYELEKQINDEAKKRVEQAKEILEYEIEQRLIDQKTIKIKEDLQRKQEELQRIEEMRKNDIQRRKDYEYRRNDGDLVSGSMANKQQQVAALMMASNNNRMHQQHQMHQHGGYDQGALLSQVFKIFIFIKILKLF